MSEQQKILTAFQEAGFPEPVFEESWGGVMVTFLKDIYTEEYLKNINLNERQIKALLYISVAPKTFLPSQILY